MCSHCSSSFLWPNDSQRLSFLSFLHMFKNCSHMFSCFSHQCCKSTHHPGSLIGIKTQDSVSNHQFVHARLAVTMQSHETDFKKNLVNNSGRTHSIQCCLAKCAPERMFNSATAPEWPSNVPSNSPSNGPGIATF